MLSIRIKKTSYDNLVAKVGEHTLFEFRYCPDVNEWRFWMCPIYMNGHTIVKKGRAFPWEYFFELCQVVAFLELNEPLWKTVHPKVVSGKSYIK